MFGDGPRPQKKGGGGIEVGVTKCLADMFKKFPGVLRPTFAVVHSVWCDSNSAASHSFACHTSL